MNDDRYERDETDAGPMSSESIVDNESVESIDLYKKYGVQPRVGPPEPNQIYITVNPAIMMGKPCVRGTRITVELIVEKLGRGETVTELLDSYPQLSPEAIRGALRYAANAVHEAWRQARAS